ncbi:flavoprotein [Streptomyces sp. CC53]|uniref:flavoprotein n=1 Tax=unclassified Streptomyces TaxID=2593676 RepID=UPI0008DCA0E6|nr:MULTISPECIES: flavoprotein [unclassified Streptomyces]OII60918.1 flavoprotein [Streptomyces sp. CC53]
MTRTLYLFCAAAPPVFDVARVVEDAQARGWDVCLGLTPTAALWLEPNLDGLAALTGHPVRHAYERPGEPDPWPAPDVVLFAPATFNTVNQWALGLTGTFVVSVAAEALGWGVPLVAAPCVNAAHVRHPQYDRSVETLRGAGVHVLHGPDAAFPWEAALDAAEEAWRPAAAP